MHNIVYVVPNVPREPFLGTVNMQHKNFSRFARGATTPIPTLIMFASLCAPAVPQQSKIPSYATAYKPQLTSSVGLAQARPNNTSECMHVGMSSV